jgi:hypothetical protein
MDCRRPFAAFLLILLVAANSPSPPLVQARWTVAERQFSALSSDPAECLKRPQSPQEQKAVLIGRAAFRTPILLGGQAARSGLSCNSCHLNGRGNPDFHFPQLSGLAGTADVTSSLMSKKRGDGVFNPKPIPDLVASPPKVSRDPADPALARFVRGLIVEEFDGPEPPAAVLAGLTAYVRAMQTQACPAADREPVSVKRAMRDAASATTSATAALRDNDPATARLILSGIRSTLGSVHERYVGLPKDQKLIAALDQELGSIQLGIDNKAADSVARITAWQSHFRRVTQKIARREQRSLYNPKRLADALAVTVLRTPATPRPIGSH